MENNTFKTKILNEMGVDYANILEKNFDVAKGFIRITNTGTIDVLDKENFTGTENILLYLIGKRYAKEARLTESEFASIKELCEELSLKKGSVLPWLKTLRDGGKLDAKKGRHAIKVNLIEGILREIINKYKTS